MDEQRPSFYNANKASRPDPVDLPGGLTEWQREVRLQKLKSALFGGAVVLIVALLAGVVTKQIKARNKIADAQTPDPKTDELSVQYNKDYKPWFGAPETPLFMLDKLEEINATEIEKGKHYPLNGTWLKQAGYHLITAEKAYRDGRLEGALEHYDKALTIYPNMGEVQQFIGLIQLQQKKYDQAILSLEKAMEETPNSHALVSNLGVCYLHTGATEKAEASFREALRLSPGYETAQYNLAMLLYREGRDEESAEAFKFYKTISPRNAEAAQTHASVLVRMERWTDAAIELEHALVLEPDVAPLNFKLAYVLTKAGQQEKAMEVLVKAITLVDSKRALAWLSRDDFTPLRAQPEFQELLERLAGRQTL